MKWYLKVVKENYANFNGRARRKEYWMFVLFNMLFTYAIAFLSGLLVTLTDNVALAFIYVIYLLAVFIPSLAVGVRRMHDVGKSGWYLLIPIYSFILAVTEGDRGVNKYGPDPKNENIEEIDQIGQVQVD
ncbi:DUF805 domain-containing protein [Aestuariibaculum sediminum]|uniref:DUF805 domain-containing protein n=1 Tax=Aestuariibaculum sediminum TaxID=2770637 RepID=A0A8J6UEB0_9FLAO|nr:DUF805 domain-containing protein [Aestuariibaculum sediminum]MBD0830596.1 DUF805 domain-containing protein [Aestuariibaculum sediminum]